MNDHDEMLDNVAVYALGALPRMQAEAVAEHLKTCERCGREYQALRPAVDALGYAAEEEPSANVRGRIMRSIARSPQKTRTSVAEMRAVRPIVWPAYAVAAACLAIAVITGAFNISLSEANRQAQAQVAQLNAHTGRLTRELVRERTAMADLISPQSQRYELASGEVVKHGSRLYIAMQGMPMPPKGKVYQAWTQHKGSTKMTPSVTFVPNGGGVAVVSVPGNAEAMAAVAVTVEPDGGSKAPTSKPEFIVKLT